MTPSLSVMVLAGGQSSRMGQDKALIPVNGIPLLRRTCDIGLHCAATVWVVTPRVSEYREIAPTACQFVQEQPLGDAPRSPGALIGFAQGLAHVTTPWVLLLACDLPFLQAEILQRWQQQLPEEPDAIALLPCTARGWEPLCGFYRRRCLETLIPYLQNGGRSFQSWLNQMPVQAIAFSCSPEEAQVETRMLFNCNTLDDLQIVQQQEF